LVSLPLLNKKLIYLCCDENPFDLLDSDDTIDKIRQQIQTLSNFKHLYFSLKFKTQFKKWLWELVREPKIALKFHPSYLAEHLVDGVELENILEEWIGNE